MMDKVYGADTDYNLLLIDTNDYEFQTNEF